MNKQISKTNVGADFFSRRLDEIRMTGSERLKAKAHLARAEAVADLIASACGGIVRVFKALAARNPRSPRPTAPSAS